MSSEPNPPTGVAAPAAPAAPERSWFAGWVADCFALDVRSLAVLRIALALLILFDLGTRAGEWTSFHSDDGIVPRGRVVNTARVSAHYLGGTVPFLAAVFAVHALFAVALLVGYQTRLATFVNCLLVISLHMRNSFILQGGDTLLRVLLFWGFFLPLGAVWSVDARAAPGPPPRRTLSAASAALILQVCLMYWVTVSLKSDPVWRRDGTAVALALHLDELATPLGIWLRGFPEVCRVLTYLTLGFEALGPLLLFSPVLRWQLRLGVVVAFVLFHLVGLNLCLVLGPFPYVCAAAWLAFLPSQFWDRLAARWGRRRAFAGGFLPAPPGFNLIAGVLLAYVVAMNVRATDPDRFDKVVPKAVNPAGFAFGLEQSWSMFALRPPLPHGWYVCQGTLRNGEQVDPLRGGRPVEWSKPAVVSAQFPNERWRKYMLNVTQSEQAPEHRAYLLHYLWESWNRTHPPERQMAELKLYYMAEITQADLTTSPPEPKLLATHPAPAAKPTDVP